MKYIALLRGINVGGNNKISMSELKQCFEAIGFDNVTTYINSGNVIFDSNQKSITTLIKQCEQAIQQTFGFKVTCCVISAQDLHKAAANAPSWWGVQNDEKHNAIFILPPHDAISVMRTVGTVKLEFENVSAQDNIIFWSAPVQTFSKTRYSKIVGTEVYKYVTIRNANTVRKLVELTQIV